MSPARGKRVQGWSYTLATAAQTPMRSGEAEGSVIEG